MSLHSQRAGLLRSIIEEPDQDFPRLVFADWLSDNGQPEWGDFIRWQCALTTCMVPVPDPFAVFHSCPREQALLLPPCFVRPEIRRAVLQPLTGLAQHFAPEQEDAFRHAPMRAYLGRGFVEWLGLNGGRAVEAFTRFAPEILSSTPLLWLCLEKEYRVTGTDPITPRQVQALLRLPEVRRLRALDLEGVRCDDEMGEVLLTVADPLPVIRTLDQLQSGQLRQSLQAAYGERMRLRPVPSYITPP